MRVVSASLLGAAALLCGALLTSAVADGRREKVDFDRDVRPILSENCFACHGPDAHTRMAGLRLDTKDGAYAKLPSGRAAIIPGKPISSELLSRVSAHDARQMPPASSGKKLTAAQIDTLRRWIHEGGQWGEHWAFVPPVKPLVPQGDRVAVGQGAADWRNWRRNPIDQFVLQQMHAEGLRPSPEADRRTLIRRVTLDLTGLPPTPKELSEFLADKSQNAYEKVVDRLLACPHFGERMAIQWLDLARYADTHGYHIDSQRDMWRWRDWVIDAYNHDLPYDQFVIQQLAGDLLPNATLEQKIATGFNRNHPINFEGGAIPEEYAAAYIEDRIDTTATAFMGLTLRCCQCHDHKFEPLSSLDYYRFYAFFNNVPEQGLDGQKGNAAPYIKAPTAEQAKQLDEYGRTVAELERREKAALADAAPTVASWEKTAAASLERSTLTAGLIAHYPLDESGTAVRDASGQQRPGTFTGKQPRGTGKFGGALQLDGAGYADIGTGITLERTDKFSYGAWINPSTVQGAGTVVSRMDDAAAFRGWDLYLGEGRIYFHLVNEWEKNAIRVNTKTPIEANRWTHVFVTYDGSSKAKGVHVYVDGKPQELEITHDSLTGSIVTPKPAHIGRRNPGAVFKGLIDEVRIYQRELSPAEVEDLVRVEGVREILGIAADKRKPAQQQELARYYLESGDAGFRKLTADLADWKKRYADLDSSIPTTMVMEEMAKPRDTFVLVRGQYDKRGDKIDHPAVPAIFHQPPKDAPPNRLTLANWLVADDHPLTARVAVNRYWQMLFGSGLVKTSENFGTQGERPSHPELLDWLACEFKAQAAGMNVMNRSATSGTRMASLRPVSLHTVHNGQPDPYACGWSVKKMMRLIVTSATYRQSSRVTKELLERDPENRLLARGPRQRLTAEVIRDQALALSGLYVPQIGGPSVKPYQPPGLWEDISFKGGFSAQYFEQDHGDKLYRRSLYTFWKRTCPPPTLQTFDAPEREFCMVRRSVTNTPLQALELMNDPTFVEASRKLAERILREAPAYERDRIQWLYNLVLCRPARTTEVDTLVGVLHAQQLRFRNDTAAAEKLLAVGESPTDKRLPKADIAAWATVASMVLNLDETITKE